MNTVTVSAPGKLLLFGDHAVVYGHPCIVTAVGERMSVSIAPTDTPQIEFDTPGVSDTRFLSAVIAEVEQHWKTSVSGVRLSTASAFSGTVGLGSSAAVTVAALVAFCIYFGKKPTHRELFEMALRVVHAVQGVGSGFDVAAALWGGTLWYEHRGKTIRELPQAPPLAIGFTGVKADTPAIVKEVAQKRSLQPETVERLFSAMTQFTHDAQTKINEKDWERIGKLMDFQQEYLRDLGVSSQPLETLIKAAKDAGAYGAKLSGAGRGDCMIAVVPEKARTRVETAIAQAGGRVIPLSLHAPGARREP